MPETVATRVAHPNGGERSYGIRFDDRSGPGPHAVVFVGHEGGWALNGTYALPLEQAEAEARQHTANGMKAHAAPILVDPTEPEAGAVLREIPLSLITTSRTNHRRKFFGRDLTELGQSFLTAGVLQPVIVRPLTLVEEDAPRGAPLYELVVGERRLRAATQVKLPTISAIVREMSDADAVEAQLIENFQRADIPPLDESDAYAELIDSGRYGSGAAAIGELALRMGKSVLHVAQRLSLRALTEPAREALDGERIALGHALLLATLDHEAQALELAALLTEKFNSPLTGWGEREIPVATMPVAELRARLLKAHREIANAQFDPADETLGGRGACGPCGRCTGGNSLFGPDEAARCLDAACWNVKTRNLLARNVEAARADHGKDVLLVGQRETYGGQAAPAWNFEHSETPVPGSVPAVDVDQGGKRVFVRALPPQQHTESAAARENRERRERNLREIAVRADVAETILGLLGEDPNPDVLLRFIATQYLNRLPSPYLHRAMVAVGLERAREVDLSGVCPEDILQMVAIGAIAHEAKAVDEYSSSFPPQSGTIAAAEAFGIDYATIRQAAETRAAAPKEASSVG